MKFMKLSILILLGIWSVAQSPVLAADQSARGSLLELHSCELYAGGCTVSSEATGEGRYLLRAWNFAEGTFNGESLKNLSLGVMQSSAQNLADATVTASDAVVYLPVNATDAQRKALLGWLKSTQSDLKSARLQTRTVPLSFARTDTGYTFSAGQFARVSTISMEACERGSCGEALWYHPRSETSMFTVAVDRGSQVSEPLLKLKWSDGGKRSVFLGKFGAETASRNVYVTAADLCGPAERLF